MLGEDELARVLLRFQAYEKLQPLVQSAQHGQLVGKALGELVGAEDLRRVASSPRRFVAGLERDESAVAQLRQSLGPRLAVHGLNWDQEALPALKALVAEGFLDAEYTPCAGAIAQGLDVERMVMLRLLRRRLAWALDMPASADVEGVLAAAAAHLSATQIAEALAEPELWIEQMLLNERGAVPEQLRKMVGGPPQGSVERRTTEPAERRISEDDELVALLEPMVEPLLTKLGVDWNTEAVPALTTLQAEGRLSDRIDPRAAAQYVLLVLLRPQLASALSIGPARVEDLLALLGGACSLERLADALFDTDTFVDEALNADDAVGRALAALLNLPAQATARNKLLQPPAPEASNSPAKQGRPSVCLKRHPGAPRPSGATRASSSDPQSSSTIDRKFPSWTRRKDPTLSTRDSIPSWKRNRVPAPSTRDSTTMMRFSQAEEGVFSSDI